MNGAKELYPVYVEIWLVLVWWEEWWLLQMYLKMGGVILKDNGLLYMGYLTLSSPPLLFLDVSFRVFDLREAFSECGQALPKLPNTTLE